MWELRLILVLIGAVIVTGVYLWSRQNRMRELDKPRTPSSRQAPVFMDEEEAHASGIAPDADAARETASGSTDDSQLILALHVAFHAEDGVAGTRVLEALHAEGLKFGRYRIFHRLLKGNPEASVFNVASMME
ncbi:MAG TPA: cell division protein ZipA C-terminal FtsZ-binding domain-containing protein, partial [Gammaproteobacteria bacterium]|nr:cell division protein ZipA C-terminal FtsZ-binding domain-containing protein [Gammaproteobacteria bacterium]